MKYVLATLDTSRLQNPEASQFIHMQRDEINKLSSEWFTDNILKKYFTGLDALLVTFDLASSKSNFSPITPEITAANELRVQSLSTLNNSYKPFVTSKIEAEKKAANVLTMVAKKYPGLSKWNYEKKSGGIRQYIGELESNTYKEYVATLKLEKYIADLKADNTAFDNLFDLRQNDKASTSYINTQEARHQLFDYYGEFCIYLLGLTNNSEAKQYQRTFAIVNKAREYYGLLLARRDAANDEDEKKNTDTKEDTK